MACVAMGVFLATIDGSIVNVALPTLQRELGANFALIEWVVLAYLLTIVTLVLSVGRLADIVGKKPLFLAGFVIFTIGSFLCGISTSVEMLIAMRIFQGLGAVLIMGLGAGIVTEAFPPEERGKAMGVIGSSVSLGIVVGPVLGGLILGSFSWHWIFIVNVPLGIVSIWMAQKFLIHTPRKQPQKFHTAGAVFLFFGLLSSLLAQTLGQHRGFLDPWSIGLFAGFVVFSFLFLVSIRRAEFPLIHPAIFKSRALLTGIVSGFLTFICISGAVLLIPFYLENLMHLDIRTVGFLMSVTPVCIGIIAPISGTISDKIGHWKIVIPGQAIIALGFFTLSRLDLHSSIFLYLLLILPVGIGMGIFQSPNNSAIMSSVSREFLGVASGLLAISRTLGQTVGVALAGAMWASRVSSRSGEVIAAEAVKAPPEFQTAALQDVFLAMSVLLLGSLLYIIWNAWNAGAIKEPRIDRAG